MKKKTISLKINVTEAERSEIDVAQKAAGYKTRAAYMLDSALLQTPLELTEIARQLGRLGLLCNDLLADEDGGAANRRLDRDDAQKAVRKIINACDAVIAALREH